MVRVVKGSKTESDFPFRECYECENIIDCPHPTVNEKGKPIPPEECKRKDEIILEKK
jgi:hypothetical protein